MASSTDNRTIFIVSAIAVVCIALIVVVAIKAAKSPSTVTTTNGTVAPDTMTKLSNISQATFDTVGLGSVTGQPTPIEATPLTKDNKPYMLYAGGEFCPFCAAERWAIVVALSRFGSFSNLSASHSSDTDVYPSTPTFSFHGSTYTSQYLAFDGVETLSNVHSGNSYTKLDTLTADQQKIVDTFDAAPYVAASSAGSIPFIDFGGFYVSSGATYSPQLLQGKTFDQIAAVLNDPNTDIAKGVIGAANVITASICKMTGAQPSVVCDATSIKQIQATIDAQQKAGVTAQ